MKTEFLKCNKIKPTLVKNVRCQNDHTLSWNVIFTKRSGRYERKKENRANNPIKIDRPSYEIVVHKAVSTFLYCFNQKENLNVVWESKCHAIFYDFEMFLLKCCSIISGLHKSCKTTKTNPGVLSLVVIFPFVLTC